ncbi:hypothetical protein SARC_01612 [Sphaeroforma arctica JP610]|uniref:UBA domain-containing protein n=1 Tax=Sphaeroforma arctica JP610 TaxID=667725 RepID=A0A0L0GB40_9EUKA|nr:hypothetical protein SARC_01612 [Sphaeroforma arctica JP610]KNC86237.1 hypothetical protein SARC_01612 [Sphaeroforma arctica JP610]|eukprot:XP_014160139.1 hypothetical protein SARC_01612 [Sphaeroforma arctica JP610]
MSYDVQSVCDILGISALQAQVLVEAHTGNIDRAVCAYLDKTIVLGDDHIPESLVPLQQLRLANVADATIVSPDEAKDARTSAGDVGDCNVIAANPETVNRDTTQHSAPNPNTYSCKPPEVNAQSAGVTNLKESHANVFDHIVPQTGTTEHIETSGDCSRTHTGELDTSDDKHVDPSIFADPQDPELDLDYPCSADTKLDSDAAIANTVGKDVLDTHLHSERNRLMDEHASLQCRMASDNLQKSVMTTPMVKSLDRSTGSKPTRNLFSDTPSNKRKRRQASMDEFSNSSHALARKRPTLAEVASQFCMPRIRMKKGFDTYEVFKGNKMVNIPLREFTRRTPTSAVEGLLPQVCWSVDDLISYVDDFISYVDDLICHADDFICYVDDFI